MIGCDIRSIAAIAFLIAGTAFGQCAEPQWTSGPIIPRAGIVMDPRHVIVADFNGDLRADIAISGDARPDLGPTTSTVIVALAVPGSDYATAGLPSIAGMDRAPIAAGDFNGDGATDLVIVKNPPVGVYLNDGKGSFTAGAPVVFSPDGAIGQPRLGDFNGDGVIDLLLLATTRAQLNVTPITSVAGGVLFGKPITTMLGAQYSDVATADFDGDGRLDAILINGGVGRLAAFRGSAAGTFSLINVHSVTPVHPGYIAIGDLNGDGRPDAVVRAGDTGIAVSLNLNDGTGRLGAPASFPLSSFPSEIFLADVNRDSRLDVVTYSGSAPYYLPGRGDGTFGTSTTIALPIAVSGFLSAVTDFDGDANPDLFYRTFGSDSFGRVFLSRCAPSRRRAVKR